MQVDGADYYAEVITAAGAEFQAFNTVAKKR
jgi:hypothetical protein